MAMDRGYVTVRSTVITWQSLQRIENYNFPYRTPFPAMIPKIIEKVIFYVKHAATSNYQINYLPQDLIIRLKILKSNTLILK